MEQQQQWEFLHKKIFLDYFMIKSFFPQQVHFNDELRDIKVKIW